MADKEEQGLASLLQSLSVKEEGPPTRPPKQSVQTVFHQYKDPLQRLPREMLPHQTELSPDHLELMLRALAHHCNAKEKIGCGVESMFVRRSIVQGRDVCCFYVKRVDGSEEDFSLHACYGTKSWKNTTGETFNSATSSFEAN